MLRIGVAVLGVASGLLLAGGAALSVVVLSRSPPGAVRSTTHASIERRGCISCHAPIAEEWRASYHFRSVAGPYWDDVRRLVFGKDEALLLDFWPFDRDERIPPGEEREIVFALPDGHGVVEAVVRYHDWMRTRRTVLTLKERY